MAATDRTRRHPPGRRPRPAGRRPGRGGARDGRRPGGGRSATRTGPLPAAASPPSRDRPRRPRTRLRPARGPAGRSRRRRAASPTAPTTPGCRTRTSATPATAARPWCRRRSTTAAWSRCSGSSSPLTNSRLDDEGDAALALGPARRERPRWSGTSRRRPTCRRRPRSRSTTWCPTGSGGGCCRSGWRCCCSRCGGPGGWAPSSSSRCPVAVRAAETEEGRARLYRRNGARGQAAESLRAGVRSRLGGALGLPRRVDPPALVDGGRRPVRLERRRRHGPPVRCRTCRRRRPGAARRPPRRARERGTPTVTAPYPDHPAAAHCRHAPTPRLATRCGPCAPRSARPSSARTRR